MPELNKRLSPREWEVLTRLKSQNQKMISMDFGVDKNTVHAQVKSAMRKLGVETQVGLGYKLSELEFSGEIEAYKPVQPHGPKTA